LMNSRGVFRRGSQSQTPLLRRSGSC
jgi:hypothetical protein